MDASGLPNMVTGQDWSWFWGDFHWAMLQVAPWLMLVVASYVVYVVLRMIMKIIRPEPVTQEDDDINYDDY